MTAHNFKDLTGLRFNRLTVIARGPNTSQEKARWYCKCDCGIDVLIHARNLSGNRTQSCGCYWADRNRMRDRRPDLQAQYPLEFGPWRGMHLRCTQKCRLAKYYFNRGIYVCARWNDFALFLLDMGARPSPNHSIDRIDNDGIYEPDNCRWATQKEQTANRRTTTFVEYKGERLAVEMLAARFGVRTITLSRRLKKGWEIERALHEPVRSFCNLNSKIRAEAA